VTDMTEERSLPQRPADNFWTDLRTLTAARIGIPRTGASIATEALLDFRLAHSRARDAVLEPLDERLLASRLAGLSDPVVCVTSAAAERTQYLMRPDLGRSLAGDAMAKLSAHAARWDVAFVVADGLSAKAVQAHAQPVLAGTIEALRRQDWRIAPLVIVRHGRVAIGDAVAAALGASCIVVLIGERPGLSAADSMGAYLTWKPHGGTTDADRNCISNIRPDGIGYSDAVRKIGHLLLAMSTQNRSGVALKDDSDRLLISD
jgi:ethanolamine ammonia-lyase small subunit